MTATKLTLRLVFRSALFCFPRELRQTLGREMVETLEAETVRRSNETGVLAATWYVIRAVVDAGREGVRERIRLHFRRGAQHGKSPLRNRWSAGSGIGSDVRLAVRAIRNAPGFAAVAVLVVALGVGGNTAVFSIVDGVLLEALPYPEPSRLMTVSHLRPGTDMRRLPSSTGMQEVYAEGASSFEAIALYRSRAANLSGVDRPERIVTATVTPSLFRVLRADASLGRVFTDDEGRPGSPDVAVIGHGLWTDRFGRDPGVIGATIHIDGIARQIVGVMGEGFAFPDWGEKVWVPLVIDPHSSDFGGFNYQSIGRLEAGATPEGAARELESLFPVLSARFSYLSRSYLEASGLTADVHPYLDDLVGNVRSALWILLCTVGVVLCIACANLANLFLARAEVRQKEVAVRIALGAGRGRLVTGFLVESALLVLLGSALGVFLAHTGLDVFKAAGGQGLPRIDTVGIDGSVLAVTGGLVSIVALIFGIVPVLRHRRTGAADVLRTGSRGAVSGRTSSQVRMLLVSSQVALALVLLVGSALMVGSFRKLRAVDPGFRAESVLTFRIPLPVADYPEWEAAAAFHVALLDRLNAHPGVEAAGAATAIPLTGRIALNPISVEGRVYDPGTLPPIVESRAVTPEYFEALGIPLVRGRMLEQSDATGRTGAVLLSRAVADLIFPNEEALGQGVAHSLPDPHDGWSTVVGVVGDVHSRSLTQQPMGILYFAIFPGEGVQKGWLARSMAYAVKTSVAPLSLLPAVRGMVAELDPAVPIADVREMEDMTRAAQAEMAFSLLMIGVAAGFGLLLAAVGLYGVVSYLTAQRTRELGVRIALGADAGRVKRMVIRQGMGVTLAGLAAGTVSAFLLTRFIDVLLFGVDAHDPVVFGSVILILATVSLAATWIPAARAARLDPVNALRAE